MQTPADAPGRWTRETLGTVMARQLAAHPASTVSIWSRSRSWQGVYAILSMPGVLGSSHCSVTWTCSPAIQSPSNSPTGAKPSSRSPRWRSADTWSSRSSTSTVARKFPSSSSRAAPWQNISPRAWGHVDYDAIVDTAAPAALRLHVVVDAAEVAPSRAGLARIGWSACAERKPTVDLPTVRPEDVAVLGYTSGTTSDPKGVIHDHRTMLSELRHMKEWVTPGKPNLIGSPVTHATGMLGVLGPLTMGEDIHTIDRWDPAHVLEVMLEAGIGGGSGASAFFSSILDHADFTAKHAALMSRGALGGSPVPLALAERAASHGMTIIRAYASTPYLSTTGCPVHHPADCRHRTDGQARPGVELRLVDVDGADVPAGTPGEILSRGPDLCLGYTDPALTAAAFDDDGWYHSGDIGVLDEHGLPDHHRSREGHHHRRRREHLRRRGRRSAAYVARCR